MPHEPLISVVMPVYNGASYLLDAVASIQSQSMTDWELICVDDGSQDESGEMLDWFAGEDSRIRVQHQANTGIVGALNAGCELARAPLLCRMDCDDVALPDRLKIQADYMAKNPHCVVVGAGILEIDSDSDPLSVSRLPLAHDDIVENLLTRRTGHFHPTTLIRADAFRAVAGYRSEYEWVEDHDLWLRLSQRGSLANLADVLLCYRQHGGSICWNRSQQQRQRMNQLLSEAYAVRGRAPSADVLFSSRTRRSKAGPGKWARAAAKGGYAETMWKHLDLLNRSQASWPYKSRMNIEVLGRYLITRAKTLAGRGSSISVPSFDDCHHRWGSRKSLRSSEISGAKSAA